MSPPLETKGGGIAKTKNIELLEFSFKLFWFLASFARAVGEQ